MPLVAWVLIGMGAIVGVWAFACDSEKLLMVALALVLAGGIAVFV